MTKVRGDGELGCLSLPWIEGAVKFEEAASWPFEGSHWEVLDQILRSTGK